MNDQLPCPVGVSKTESRTIAFQGETGAFSYQACREVYPDWLPLPCPTFEETLDSVRSGQPDLAMVPIENSLYGRVADLHRLLPDSNLFIIGEHFLPIHLHLMAPKGTTLKEIVQAYSHPVALGQCSRFLRAHGIHPVAESDTAGAARMISEKALKGCAAVASKSASEIYHLEILAEKIEDARHNTTRFLVMSLQKDFAKLSGKPTMISLLFRVRNVPSALYKAMGGFATNGVNMTKLESYMVGGQFMATQFYAEIEGHPEQPHVARALTELKYFTNDFFMMGVYESHRSRHRQEDL